MSSQPVPTILVVEDETKVAAFLRRGLETQSFRALVAPDGSTARQLLGDPAIDLVILDLNLPDVSGLEISEVIRQQRPTLPILMLTALDTTADKLAGFEAGADDYLVKPFEFLELLARVKALLRRSAEKEEQRAVLRVADLELDLDQKIARRAGQDIELTAREYLLLEYLMRNRGRVLSRLDIAENVWDIHFDTGTNVIDVYINYLRKKIDASGAKLIHTVVGMGYTLKEK